MALQRLFPPLLGVSEDGPLTDQEGGTARDAENVQTPDPKTGRMRLSKRPGLQKFTSPSTALGTGKVRDLAQLVVNDYAADFTGLSTPTEEWETESSTFKGGQLCRMSNRGDLFVLEAEDGDMVTRVNADGVVISQTALDNDEADQNPTPGAGPHFDVLALGNDDSFFVCLSDDTSGVTGRFIRIMRYALGSDGEYFKAWELKSGGDKPNNALFVKAAVVKKNRLYTLQQADAATTALRLRVYGNIYSTVPPKLIKDFTFLASAANNVARGLDVNDAGEVFISYLDANVQTLSKYAYSSMAQLWTITGATRGGLGNAVAVRDGYIWTLGFPAADNTWLAQYTDGASPTHNWSKTNANAESKPYMNLAVDKFLNVHAALPRVTHMAGDDLFGYDVSGNLLYDYDTPSATPVRGVALPPTNPDFSGSAVSPERPEFLYYAAQGENYFKLRLASVVGASGSPRTFKFVGVVDSDVKTFTDAAVATPTGGSNVISTTTQYVQSAVVLGKLYIADGELYWKYDPVEDEVTEHLSETSGLIPQRCRLIESWRTRLVLAGDPDNRHALYMSAMGNAADWDFFPPTPTSKQAIYTALMPQSDAVSDIINAIAPISNDLLLIGGDHSLRILRGDPAAGGTVDLITEQIGMAWGRPYCFDPDGNFYLFSQQGGVHVIPGGYGMPRSISRGRMERQHTDLDLSTHYIRMAWIPRLDGLLVTQCPFGAGGTTVRAWFWSRRTNAWWPWRFGTGSQTGVQATAICTIDGDDPNDRTTLIGGEDGYVRRLNEDVAYDELASGSQYGIESYALLGPFSSEDRTHQVMANGLWATLAGAGQCTWQVFTPVRPDAQLTTAAQFGVLKPGYSARIALRVKSPYLYLKLMDFQASMPWSIESLGMDLEIGARERRRA